MENKEAILKAEDFLKDKIKNNGWSKLNKLPFSLYEAVSIVMTEFSASQNSELKKENELLEERDILWQNKHELLKEEIEKLQTTIEELRNKNKQANEFICDIAKLLGEDDLGFDGKTWSIDDFRDAIKSTIEEKDKTIEQMIIEKNKLLFDNLKWTAEIERLKGLIEKAYTIGYDESSFAHDANLQEQHEPPTTWQQFKTENQL